MKDVDLMRRISDALDAPGGLDADDGLRDVLAEDADAARYAEDLQAIDAALGELRGSRAQPDWDAMFERIESRLDHALDEDLEGLVDQSDPIGPPRFADLEGLVEQSDAPARALEGLVHHEVVIAPSAAPVARAAAREGQVVDLASARARRRQIITVLGGLAAAAAVGLGITTGLSVNDAAPASSYPMAEEAEQAAAPAAVAEVPAAAPAPPVMMPAEAEPSPEPMAAADAPDEGAIARSRAPRPIAARGGMAGPTDELQDGWGGSGGGALAPGRSTGAATATGTSVRQDPMAEPTRAEVVNALNAVADEVARCMTDTQELARVRVRVNGSTGAVETVTVSPPYTGAEAACIVRAVRAAQMPRSAHPSYDVMHAYHPAPIAGGSLRPSAPAARRARERAAPPASRDSADILSPFAE